MSEIGRACLIETGCKSRGWERCRHICSKFGLMELVSLIILRDASVNKMVSLGMKMDRKVWKKYISENTGGWQGRMGSMRQKGRKSMCKRKDAQGMRVLLTEVLVLE